MQRAFYSAKIWQLPPPLTPLLMKFIFCLGLVETSLIPAIYMLYTIYQSCVFSYRVMIMMDQAGCRCLGLPNSGEFHSIGASTRRSPI